MEDSYLVAINANASKNTTVDHSCQPIFNSQVGSKITLLLTFILDTEASTRN